MQQNASNQCNLPRKRIAVQPDRLIHETDEKQHCASLSLGVRALASCPATEATRRSADDISYSLVAVNDSKTSIVETTETNATQPAKQQENTR